MLTYLHKIKSIPELIKEWDRLDKSGTDLGAIRALCLTDLYYLLVKVCRRVDLLHPWQYQRCREVEANPNNHIDIWFREAGKSSIITFGKTIQDILNDPELTVGIFSQTGGIASKFLIQIKNELEKNEILLACFPDILYENPSRDAPNWNQGSITVKRRGNPKESTVEASGLVDSMPIGRHYKLLIYDDVVTPTSVSTSDQIRKTTEAFELSLSLGSEGANKRIIGTRYSFADTYSTIIDRGVVKLRLHAATDDGSIDGNPVLFSRDYWNQKKIEVSPSVLACQYMGDPLSGTERMFDVSDLETYEIRPHSLNIYIMCDPAKSMNQGSDNSAYCVIGLDAQMNKYLLDGLNHKMDLQDRWTNLLYLYRKWQRVPGVQRVFVGYEKYSAIADLDYFKEQMKITGTHFNIQELSWVVGASRGEQSKTARVQRLGPDLRSHKFFIPYKTDPSKLTKLQQNMMDQGFAYRVAKPIIRIDNDKNRYDVTEDFVMQLNFFPVGKKDFVDAASRLYDMDIKPPAITQEGNYLLLEPEFP